MMSSQRLTAIVGAVVIGFAAAAPASAQWKWRDRAGHVQYSDMPPPSGTPESDVLQRPSAATGASRRTAVAPIAAGTGIAPAPAAASTPPLLAPRASDPELEARRRQADQEAADRKRADEAKAAAARAENCARAQEAKRTVDSGVRITRTNAQGEREYLDDAARAVEARRAQQVITTDCR